MRQALKDNIVTMQDFWQDDDFVVNKLLKSKDINIQSMLDVLKNKSLVNLDKGDVVVYKKFRHVNPSFINEEKIGLTKRCQPEFFE